MRLGKSSIDYMLRVLGIAQRMQGVKTDRIIPLFVIASLGHESYTGVKIRYLAVDTALVNCGLLQLIGILSREETRQRALGIPNIPHLPPLSIMCRIHKITFRMNAPPHSHTNPQHNNPTSHTHPQGGYLGNAYPQ